MPRPTPVVTLIDTVRLQGGAERLAVDVACRLDRRRFEPTVCISRWAPDWFDELDRPGLDRLRDAGVRVTWIRRYGKLDVLPWRGLVGELLRRRVGVLHAHKFGSNFWAATLGPLARVPAVVAHEHTWSFEGQLVRRLVDRHVVARGADAIIAVSRDDVRKMVEVEGIPASMIRFIPNGVAVLPRASSAGITRELDLDDGVPVIGAVGSLRAQKAFEVLIEAAALLRRRGPIRVVIAGDGDQREHLERQRTVHGVEDVVQILGNRNDVPDLLESFDVFVNCSDFEGQPLSVLEAMDAGLPIVATEVGGTPDFIADGVHGRLVPARDPAALAAAVGDLLDDPEQARALGEAARRRRRSEFDLDVTVARIEDLYDELLSARRDTPSMAGPIASSSHNSFE